MALVSSSIVRFPDDSVFYLVPNWDELTQLCFDVSVQIRTSGHLFPVMVTLAKGGYPLARILADFLEIPLIVSMGVHFYTGIGTRLDAPQVYQDISPVATIRGQNILLFDDVADSGESLLFAQDYLQKAGATSITTSALYYKEKSKIIPDYYGKTTSEWIIFPFEAMETYRYLSGRWTREGVSQSEQYRRLAQLGIKQQWVIKGGE